MLNTFKKSMAIAAAALSLTACGGNVEQVLKDANLDFVDQNGQKYVSLMTELDTKNLVISAVTLPVANGLGMVEILSDITTQKTYLKLTFNLGKAISLPTPTYSSTLPNGTVLPLAGIDLNKVMAFNVGSNGSKVYLYYDLHGKKAVLGTALNVESLAIGTPANLLAAFDFGGVTGIAGLYFGQQPKTSGLGIFANLSSVFNASQAPMSLAKAGTPVSFIPMKLTAEQQGRLDKKLYQLSVSGQPIVVK